MFGCWIIGVGSGLVASSAVSTSIVLAALRRIEKGLATKENGLLSLVCIVCSCCDGDTL